MRPLGLTEALAFSPAGAGPRVSVYFKGKPDGQGRLREPFIRDASQQASELIQATYDRDVASAAARQLRIGLRELAQESCGQTAGFGYFWTQSAARGFKVPIDVPDQVVTSDQFHIKPLVEARELKQDFILIVDHGTRIEVYRVLPAKLCQLQVFKTEDRRASSWLKPVIAVGIANVVRWAMTLAPVPILIAADGEEAEWIKDVLLWVDVPKVTLTTRLAIALDCDSLFEAARRTMDPMFERLRNESVMRLSNPGFHEIRIHGIENVGLALARGRVRSLFVADDQCVWGRYTCDTGQCCSHGTQLDAHDGDILNSFIQLATQRKIPLHVVPTALLPFGAQAVAICTSTSATRDFFPVAVMTKPKVLSA